MATMLNTCMASQATCMVGAKYLGGAQIVGLMCSSSGGQLQMFGIAGGMPGDTSDVVWDGLGWFEKSSE